VAQHPKNAASNPIVNEIVQPNHHLFCSRIEKHDLPDQQTAVVKDMDRIWRVFEAKLEQEETHQANARMKASGEIHMDKMDRRHGPNDF